MEQQVDGVRAEDIASAADDESRRRGTQVPKSSIVERHSLAWLVVGLVLVAVATLGAAGTLAVSVGLPLDSSVTGVVVVFGVLVLLAGVVAVFGWWLLLEIGVAIHEAGHALAGRLVGFRFVECRVGPLMLQRTRNGLRLMRSGRYDGGYTRSVPMVGDHLRARQVVFLAGGPLMTVVWIGVLVAVTLAIPAIAAIAWFNAIVWTLLLTVDLLPIRIRGHDTPGRLILRALRGGPTLALTCTRRDGVCT